ncbi:MAG: hypothetical protein FWC47_01250 [Oscillospiraceae bacterium]|nr:hypothetical protein [Oscillospiraceae bacterium]
MPLFEVISNNLFPVLLQKPSISLKNAESVVDISIISKSFASLRASDSLTIGPGH